MKYPIYITRHRNPRYRGALPDFPEVDVEGDSYGELQAAAAQRVMARYDRSLRLIPPPTTDMLALQASEVDTGDGIWRFFDIDLTRMTSSSVRIELCLPKRIVHDIDRTASGLHTTRDAFVSMACEHATVRSAQHGGGVANPPRNRCRAGVDFSVIPQLDRSRLHAGSRHAHDKYSFKIKWLLSG
ncbi:MULTISPECIES: type II toxin-antitoxin system HicB family antitoxin [Burkholderia]|uniref:type II toxin-antitoxin system HicB family antitoxin n=1 Tax=Burkholderia TaxID=32008 RepID=UPI001CF5A7A8|nr:type II toxin-antitoxin system HicB family antitoxin [Burkholderia cepacia]MCA8056060.1 type II toxin-antitoxin system HicB family antitoxin [Burkholderia cepacia]MCA8133277.1 type II toxin-antitoxin system HicB family antitoxin [Burkholderia cepacia]MCA8160327.1 type II toxin-antitoxin system HicB family antitoxin [Burkholderia cepacia]